MTERAALDWLRARRGAGRLRRAGYTAYVTTLLFGTWAGTYGFGLLLSIERGGAFVEQADRIAAGLPYGLVALSLVALALVAVDAVWRGPVVLPRHDADWLLPMPVPRWPLLRPWLLLSSGVLLLAGLAAGVGTALVLAAAGLGGLGELLAACWPPACGMALLAVGVAVAVQRLPAAGRLARRLAVPALGLAGVFCWLAVTAGERPPPGWVEDAALWSGPWGWAGQPALAAAGLGAPHWPVAAALLGGCAVAALLPVRRLVTTMPAATLRARSRAVWQVSAAALALEPRAVRLALAGASGGGAGFPRLARWRRRLRPPRSRRLAVPWRDAVGLLAEPRRLGAAAALLAAAGVFLRPGTVVATALAAALGYAAAGRLLEPARLDAEDPRRARLWWSGTAAGLALRHTLTPGAALLALGLPVGLACGTLPALLAAVPVLVAAGLVAAHQAPPPTWLPVAVSAAWRLAAPLAAVAGLTLALSLADAWSTLAACAALTTALLRRATHRRSV
ncbi:hypothetical protein E1265_14160 [Streptomyces sp. 8K308]|uniref:hypothetical protein n=1 Tax=Streptomyces sp. 8K308 TaxID=2530388 RepID=UPI001051F8C0|nr:hypothetical protein [Streptomyces sp. 8K308]TDC22983.1 hypothetical protein E1265_14160 [Streptomyces sp. 8K308]